MMHTVWIIVRCAVIALLGVYAMRRKALTPWIFVAMIAGTELGYDAPHVAVRFHVFSDIFLRLIKTIVAPLILSTLIVGIAGHGDLKSLGRVGVKSLVYFEVVTTLALVIGLVAINLVHAGEGIAVQATTTLQATATAPLRWDDFLLHMFPENIAKSIAEGQILQVAVFAIFIGISLALVREERRAPILALFESLSEVMFKFTNIVMYLSPLAVAGAMAFTVGSNGLGVLLHLGKVVLTLYGALLAFGVLVLVPVMLLFGLPVRKFLKAVAEPATIAFSTATSEAALPTAMEQMEAFGVPRWIVAFVIPAGYSFNLAGSTLYLAISIVFVARAGGIHLTLGEQLTMMVTLMLTSKGIAGVPRAMLVVLLATASTFHLPLAPVAMLLGVDVLMDMGRTMTNVVGNCLASAVVAKWEGEFGRELPSEAVLEGAEI
jgi:proton glutamate symport protein